MRHLERINNRRGITLIECALSAAILATITVAGLRASGVAATVDAGTAQRATATQLAASLLAEITRFPYSDPAGGTAIGIDAGETAGKRSTYDDADDFHGHVESPPQDALGTDIAALAGWTRSVAVARVTLANPTVSSGTETGLRSITVTVFRAGKVVRRLEALMSNAP